MAKIDWVFQNENGTNLNRYIATNVATGEKVTFDLLRGANISIAGTSLDAFTMNSLINAINENYDEFTTLNTKVTNIGKQVETNTKDISSMSTSLGNHNDRISANATNIMNNANNIDTNINNISKLQKSVENLNDTIIEVQEENSIINLGECGDPSSTTNTTLNTIVTQGIYKFTNGNQSYLMLIYKPSDKYIIQHIYSANGTGGFLAKFERSTPNAGASWSVKGYAGASKDYVDTQIAKNKRYVHYIRIEKDVKEDKTLIYEGFQLSTMVITNSSTPFDMKTLHKYYATAVSHTNSNPEVPATGYVVLYLNSKNTLLQAHGFSISNSYVWIKYLRPDANTYGTSGNILTTNATVVDTVIPM